jgi:CheY-like chemotaxis protein
MPRTSLIATIVAVFLVLAVAATLGGAIWIARSQAIEEWQRQIDNLSLVLSEQTAQEVRSAYLVRQLSTRMGGGVTVSSAAGRGAVFEAHIVAPPLAAVAGEGLRLHGHVLVAEDGIDNRPLVGVFLDSLGLTHEAVDNGALALERAASGHVDLVLMDIRMPVLDGVSATEALRAQGFDKPIIAFTANLMPEDLARERARRSRSLP